MGALFMSAVAVALSVSQVFLDSSRARGALALGGSCVLAVSLYATVRRVNVMLANTAIFMFVRQCVQPNTGDVMFVWMTQAADGPQFSPRMLGWIDCFSSLSLRLGVTLYN